MMLSQRSVGLALTLLVLAMPALAGETPAPRDAKVYIVSPEDGATVSSPVKVVFGLSGMGVAPAGTEKDKTGHHHLIINAGLPPLDEPIPADKNYRHFGGGQTEVMLELPKGSHSLQLLMGDQNHIPHNPPVTSDTVVITVK